MTLSAADTSFGTIQELAVAVVAAVVQAVDASQSLREDDEVKEDGAVRVSCCGSLPRVDNAAVWSKLQRSRYR